MTKMQEYSLLQAIALARPPWLQTERNEFNWPPLNVIPGADNAELMKDPKFIAGYEYGHHRLADLVNYIIHAEAAELAKTFGKA